MDAYTGQLNMLLKKQGLDPAIPVRLSDCRIIRPDKLKRRGLDPDSELFAYMLCVPYLTPHPKKNISSYAVPRDYHLFFSQLFEDITHQLSDLYPQYKHVGFSDNSPIDERHAAATAGLGIIGKNGMLITEKYSSYVFIGEIITDHPVSDAVKREVLCCEDCGRCSAACPMEQCVMCYSELTQKKGALTNTQRRIIAKQGCAWGCDICQEVCPHTEAAIAAGSIYTPISFFLEDCIPLLSRDMIEGMDDSRFAARAYSWRKKETILRNLEIIEKRDER